MVKSYASMLKGSGGRRKMERQPVDWLLGLVGCLADAAWRQRWAEQGGAALRVVAKSKTFRVDCSNTAEVKH